jgi:hypothetical protein
LPERTISTPRIAIPCCVTVTSIECLGSS